MFEVKESPNDPRYPYHVRDLHISDPCILADEKTGLYYTYVQFIDQKRFPEVPAGRGYFYVFSSEDLIHWSEPEVCFEKGDFWADLDYWAPEIHFYEGRYVLISSFRAEGQYRRCQCLVSDSPKGPFVPAGEPVTPPGWQCLDGTLFVDDSGQPWMVFCHEWLQIGDGQICAVPMKKDLSGADGDVRILFRASDGPWTGPQTKGGNVTDGPFLHRLPSGKLLMLWSSFSEGGAYTIGMAVSPFGRIEGPWVQKKEPLYALDGAHAMLFKTFSGQLMMACHCPNDHPRKRILLFEMEEREDEVAIINEVTGNWFGAAGGAAGRYSYRENCREHAWFLQDPRAKR